MLLRLPCSFCSAATSRECSISPHSCSYLLLYGYDERARLSNAPVWTCCRCASGLRGILRQPSRQCLWSSVQETSSCFRSAPSALQMAALPDHLRSARAFPCRAERHAACDGGRHCRHERNSSRDGRYALPRSLAYHWKYRRCLLLFSAVFPASVSIYAYIGVIGGIGVGFSAKYGWQAVFNTFGALAIATSAYGLKARSVCVSRRMCSAWSLRCCLPDSPPPFARWEQSCEAEKQLFCANAQNAVSLRTPSTIFIKPVDIAVNLWFNAISKTTRRNSQ